jgi:hypothetical protein
VISRLKAPHISRFVYSSSLKHPDHNVKLSAFSAVFARNLRGTGIFFVFANIKQKCEITL